MPWCPGAGPGSAATYAAAGSSRCILAPTLTRFVVDATVVIHLVTEGLDVAKGHELVAPTLIRSQVLSLLHESVARGELDAKDGPRAAAGGVAAADPAAR